MKKITSLLTLLFFLVGGVNVWGQLPQGLELTQDQNKPVYYHIKSKRTNQGANVYLRYNDDNTKPTRVATVADAGADAFWYFMGDANSQTVKIYSISGKAMNTNFFFTTEGSNWYIKTNQYNPGAYTISNDANVESGKHCIDAQGSSVGYWNSVNGDNEGTAWFLEKANAAPDFAASINSLKAKVNKTALINGNGKNTYVGFMNETTKTQLQQLIDATQNSATYNDVIALETEINKIMAPNFEDGAYYLIEHQNRGSKKYPSTQKMHFDKDGSFIHNNPYDNRKIYRVTNESPLLPRLWKFEKQTNGTYKIRNANTGCNWSEYINDGAVIDMPVDPARGGEYTIEFVPCNANGNTGVEAFNTKFFLKSGGKMINALGGDPGDFLNNYAGNHEGDAGNYWSFKKVTEVPVKIGAASWASVCMPFAVTIPAEVKAYVAASAENNVITLQEVTGTVPAKTAMIITGTANTSANFTIAKEVQAAAVTTNLFKGTTTERINFNADETFALGATTNNGVAFVKNQVKKTFEWTENNAQKTHTTGLVPANKAYILASDLNGTAQGATVLSIEFGGATTGIEGVEAEDTKNVIYFDLNGRRVLNPSNGVFVTNTGKKVFIR